MTFHLKWTVGSIWKSSVLQFVGVTFLLHHIISNGSLLAMSACTLLPQSRLQSGSKVNTIRSPSEYSGRPAACSQGTPTLYLNQQWTQGNLPQCVARPLETFKLFLWCIRSGNATLLGAFEDPGSWQSGTNHSGSYFLTTSSKNGMRFLQHQIFFSKRSLKCLEI